MPGSQLDGDAHRQACVPGPGVVLVVVVVVVVVVVQAAWHSPSVA